MSAVTDLVNEQSFLPLQSDIPQGMTIADYRHWRHRRDESNQQREGAMKRLFHFLSIACVASLVTAGGAAANHTGGVGASIEAGPLYTEASSDQLIRDTRERAARIRSQARQRSDELVRRARVIYVTAVRDVGFTSNAALNRARDTYSGAVTRARRISLRANRRVRRLQARVVRGLRYAREAQDLAISRARSSVGGAYALVSSTGQVLEQSGGVMVTHPATGSYVVLFRTVPGCGALYGISPVRSAFGSLRLDLASATSMRVANRSVSGDLQDEGFFLAVSC